MLNLPSRVHRCGRVRRRAAFVAVMQTTSLRHRDDGPLGRLRDRPGHGRVFVQREVRPGALIILGVGEQGATQAGLRAHDDVVEHSRRTELMNRSA